MNQVWQEEKPEWSTKKRIEIIVKYEGQNIMKRLQTLEASTG